MNIVPRTLPPLHRQQGAHLPELAPALIVFLVLLLGVIEIARAMYIFNTVYEVTRRAANAALSTDFSNSAQMDAIRAKSIFRTSAGTLFFGYPLTDEHVKIEYLALTRNGSNELSMTAIPSSALPSSPANNRLVCAADPNGASCIRFVRAQICDPQGSGDCDAVVYKAIVPLIDLAITIPRAATIATAERVGYVQGASPTP